MDKLKITIGSARFALSSVAIVIALPSIMPLPALAQTSAAPPSSANSGVEEVVVTARRREEVSSRVPLTVLSLGQEALRDRTVRTESDLVMATPGLNVVATQNQNDFNYAARGQSVDAYTNSLPAVPSYFDDFQTQSLNQGSLYDLSNVQVLKGPQGTLFGRNSTGGAVLFQTASPDFDGLHGYVQAGIGNYDMHALQGVVNIPVDDQLAIRLSADFMRHDGYILNVVNGQHLDGDNRASGRASVLWQPTSKFKDTFVVQFDHNHDDGQAQPVLSVNAPGNYTINGTSYPLFTLFQSLYNEATFNAEFGPGAWQTFLAAHPGTTPGGPVQFAAIQQARKNWTVSLDAPLLDLGDGETYVNTTEYDVGGNVTLKNIVGYALSHRYYKLDLDGTPFPMIPDSNYNRDDYTYSEEFQVNGSALADTLTYTTGLYYAVAHTRQDLDASIFDFSPYDPSHLSSFISTHFDDAGTYTTQAVYAQGTQKLDWVLTGLSATIGGRYTWEKDVAQSFAVPPPAIQSGEPPARLDGRNDKPSWSLGLEYQVTPELLVYAEQRGSWRSGGFNLTAPFIDTLAQDGGALFKPETATDEEVGVKYSGTLASVPVRLALAGYNEDVENVQRVMEVVLPSGAQSPLTYNVPGTTTFRGFEADVSAVPADWLSLGGTITTLDAEFQQPNVVTFFSGTPEQFVTAFTSVSDAPRFSGDLWAEVRFPTPEAFGDVVGRVDFYKQTSFFISNNPTTSAPNTLLPGYELLNLRLDWRGMFGSSFDAGVFVRNALNKYYYIGGESLSTQLGLNTAVPGQPRMFGLEVRYSFGQE